MKKAFTLIELLVVIAIIAVLTGIVMASFSQAKSKSRDAERISEIAQIQLAIHLYFDRCGQYPDSTASSRAENGPTATIDLTSNDCPGSVTLQTFLNQIPNPPSNPNPATDPSYNYRYIVRKNGSINTDYYLAVRLENNNSALSDDLDGMIGGQTGWLGYSLTTGGYGEWSASDDVQNNYLVYAVGSK